MFDITIIGGGMVGAAMALGSARLGLKVALLETMPPKSVAASEPYDLRISAISAGSIALLESLGAWPDVLAQRATPYRSLATWELGQSKVSFDAKALDRDMLGYMVENRAIQWALWQQLKQYPQVELVESKAASWQRSPHAQHRENAQCGDHYQLMLENGRAIETRWLIGADGANSWVRQQAMIGLSEFDYRQHCLLMIAETQTPHLEQTWQWFTPSGPRALLPLSESHTCLVWYDNPKRIQALSQMHLSQLSEQVMQAFPEKLGEVAIISRGSFPLRRRHAKTYIAPSLALLGDAAHTIHPLAGQGVNLGFKDVAVLLEEMEKRQAHWCQQETLQVYQQRRQPDNWLMQSAMDSFYLGFSNDCLPLKIARNAGLALAQRAGPLKKLALSYALGL
ncbi:3-demethoxyubiquinol 3-hydroxylase [Vibrio stylophorae]|uniref:3-demethoxyubiquinol 3-hydroxylase n=1 Tax=Vibrio stylophorae TaxID=659351 RepID=A0ABM8ZUL9_9VIBR|nr:FAD-dependent monooxygenase [Vibrio stylophorae]CAH0534025.1 3-demethoxyubiquinol 3-hydroxylase [Vibrio stylophorae]